MNAAAENSESIGENLNRKRSYGKNRTIQVKVNMSDEEVELIDRLGELGYGNEGSRAATLRQAIVDIFKIYNEAQISDINQLADEIVHMSNSINSNNNRHETQTLDSPTQPVGSEYIVIDDIKNLKQNILYAIGHPKPRVSLALQVATQKLPRSLMRFWRVYLWCSR